MKLKMVLPPSWNAKPCRHVLKTFIKQYNTDPRHAARPLREASAQIGRGRGGVELVTHRRIGEAVRPGDELCVHDPAAASHTTATDRPVLFYKVQRPAGAVVKSAPRSDVGTTLGVCARWQLLRVADVGDEWARLTADDENLAALRDTPAGSRAISEDDAKHGGAPRGKLDGWVRLEGLSPIIVDPSAPDAAPQVEPPPQARFPDARKEQWLRTHPNRPSSEYEASDADLRAESARDWYATTSGGGHWG